MSQGTSSSSTVAGDSLELQLGSMSQLFNAPLVNPLSTSITEVLGVSGADYLLNLLHMDKQRLQARRLIIRLPASQMQDADAATATQALHRFAESRIERERRDLHNIHRHGWRVAGIAIVILAICIALSHLFASDMLSWMRPLFRQTFEYGFEIVGWVTLWNPVDILLFSPIAIRLRLRALRTLAAVDVVIQPCQSQGGVVP